MICSIALPDETFEAYAKYTPESPQKGIEAQLERFKGIPPSERALIFTSSERGSLEKLFGRPIEAAGDLEKWIRKLQEVEVGGVSVPLSEGQVKRLASNANFFGEKPRVMLERKIRTALNDAIGV